MAIGHRESGTYLTSRLLFEISGVRPRQIVAIGNAKALTLLQSGSIDALITIDGFPVERLALDVSPTDALHLVPIIHEGIRALYPASRIPAGTYPWQVADVETVSVKAVLVAYDFRNHHCDTIGTVARLVMENMEWLRFNGHPKWASVDLNASVKGADRYRCVNNDAPTPIESASESLPASEPNPVADAIEGVFRP